MAAYAIKSFQCLFVTNTNIEMFTGELFYIRYLIKLIVIYILYSF